MASLTSSAEPTRPSSAKSTPPRRPRKPDYNHIHRNLLPLPVYPLPPLIPHNPLSLVAIALSYLVQVLATPPRPTYKGYFSSATSSIHVTDADTIRKLWEMGFFGRGNLSRSEPTWLENRKKKGTTAEENTAQRRQERRRQKLERARKELEEVDQKLSDESQPDGRPNGHINSASQENILKTNATDISDIGSVLDSASGTVTPDVEEEKENGPIHGYDEWKRSIEVNGILTPPPTSTSSEASHIEGRPTQRLQRTKTVRFSPTIEAREFDLSSPVISPIKSPGSSPLEPSTPVGAAPVQEAQEHLTLSTEEAFFLSYGLGVLEVYCDDSETVLPPSSLLSLFRRHSYHPPRSLSMPASPDDPFMVSYAVYHHYRSLGWVVRSGIKFSTDYLLYNRGPAFSHADFAVVIVPSYSDPYWTTGDDKNHQSKDWWWLHGVNRVQAQVRKQLVLCYVDIPRPLKEEEKGKDVDIGLLLSRYKIRDINVRRWTPNRSRD